MTEYCYYIPLFGEFCIDKTEVLVSTSALLTVAALGFSISASIYSNLLHTAEMADGNALQGNNIISESYWRKMSRDLRGLVKSRAYSANCCLWSLILVISYLVLVITQEKMTCWYLIPFGVSIAFLIIALCIPKLVLCEKLDKCLAKIKWPIIPEPPRLT